MSAEDEPLIKQVSDERQRLQARYAALGKTLEETMRSLPEGLLRQAASELICIAKDVNDTLLSPFPPAASDQGSIRFRSVGEMGSLANMDALAHMDLYMPLSEYDWDKLQITHEKILAKTAEYTSEAKDALSASSAAFETASLGADIIEQITSMIASTYLADELRSHSTYELDCIYKWSQSLVPACERLAVSVSTLALLSPSEACSSASDDTAPKRCCEYHTAEYETHQAAELWLSLWSGMPFSVTFEFVTPPFRVLSSHDAAAVITYDSGSRYMFGMYLSRSPLKMEMGQLVDFRATYDGHLDLFGPKKSPLTVKDARALAESAKNIDLGRLTDDIQQILPAYGHTA